jgi:hypothetical protein
MASMLASLTAIFPVWLFSLPGALELYVCGYSPVVSILFIIAHMTMNRVFDPIILTEPAPHAPLGARVSTQMSPYMIGLAAYVQPQP